ncbi:biotin--[acetyl-CoA-carboxylase] ligase [Nonlabens sp.]|uniref:biotin--[acetyl-CoA-carboxylase] ligase n=1 Tax=Nonlabens sp. TaxID=1888209 RepID=UPI002639B57B|nr:biotin--[acetyl-CoA-carboxylase] ligase [Nonlabens sp.]
MNIVKLHATTSTNEELKSRFRESALPHLTTLYTMEQTNGKGQQGTTWISEKGKNLTFSILLTENIQNLTPFLINKLLSVTLVEWLKKELQVQATIKWPNDILSVHHKLAGILIENNFSGKLLTSSVVGIGLNVNQETFENLPRAISLKNITGSAFDLERLLIGFLNLLQTNLRDPLRVTQEYHRYLYKYNQMTSFKSSKGFFQGIVKGTDPDGKLLLQVNDQLNAFELKELEWVY